MGDKSAIIVAVETYQDPRITLVSYAEADAKEFYEALKLHGYSEDNTQLLLSGSATNCFSLAFSRFSPLTSDLFVSLAVPWLISPCLPP